MEVARIDPPATPAPSPFSFLLSGLAACTTTTFRFLDEAERQKINQEKKKNDKAAGKSA